MDFRQVNVAIGIVFHRAKFLICQRRTHGPLGGYWEFPGGKLEPGETLEQCLVRELVEELAIHVRPIESLPLIDWQYPTAQVRLHPYLCELISGDPSPLATQQFAWVDPAELSQYRFPPANDDLIASLIKRFA